MGLRWQAGARDTGEEAAVLLQPGAVRPEPRHSSEEGAARCQARVQTPTARLAETAEGGPPLWNDWVNKGPFNNGKETGGADGQGQMNSVWDT